MKKYILLYLLCVSSLAFSQVDYSDSWEDFYSYNNVKDFVKVDNIIYALVDNAVFTYNESTLEINKFSSIQGLSGETTSSIYFSSAFRRLVIGYENGLVEVIDENETITISSDIVNFNQSREKSINHISGFGNILYLSTPFAIVEYNIEKLEFGDTFFIGNGSTSLNINETLIFDNRIYAVTEDGVFTADVTSNLLIDFNSWIQQEASRDFDKIILFNKVIYVASGTTLFQYDTTGLTPIKDFLETIINLNTSNTNIIITLNKKAILLDTALNEILEFGAVTDFDFTLTSALFIDNKVYLGTKEFGVLKAMSNQINSYEEIHPEGPLFNDVFSIAVKDNNLWVVYGGYNITYTPQQVKKGFSHFNGENWKNTQFNSSLPNDLVDITIDPEIENKVYISALGITNNINLAPTGGLFVVENDVLTESYNHLNSSFEPITVSLPSINIRVSTSVFDSQGNLWATNYETNRELNKRTSSGQWSSVDLRDVKTTASAGLSEMVIDRNNSIWIGTRGNGVFVYNENGNRKKALIETTNLGNLPDSNVKTVAVDRSNRIWLGTRSGMVVFRNASTVFDTDVLNAQPVIIEENGIGERLLGDQNINSIVVDGADNKWFGTDNGGVLYTNPSGQITLANFSKANSPLPSNRILKIRVDDSAGKVYFATDKGIVAYNSNVSPFGEVLADVYAYPNPALKIHETVTIDGRNGTHLPKGTNVKILDVAGYLVYETNVVEGQQLQGGKVVWNKKNLAGKNVASGVYIVLLSNNDGSETATTKIAIIN